MVRLDKIAQSLKREYDAFLHPFAREVHLGNFSPKGLVGEPISVMAQSEEIPTHIVRQTSGHLSGDVTIGSLCVEQVCGIY